MTSPACDRSWTFQSVCTHHRRAENHLNHYGCHSESHTDLGVFVFIGTVITPCILYPFNVDLAFFCVFANRQENCLKFSVPERVLCHHFHPKMYDCWPFYYKSVCCSISTNISGFHLRQSKHLDFGEKALVIMGMKQRGTC